MMKKSILIVLLLLGSLQAKNYDKDVTMPSMAFPIPVDKNIIVMQRNCQWCHSYGYIINQGKQSREYWRHIVHKMRDTFKAPISKRDEKIVLEYLMKYFGKKTD